MKSHNQPAGGVLPTKAAHAALSWCAAALQAAIPFDDMESSVRLFNTGESKTINEILDLANAALTPVAPVPADPVAANWTRIEDCDLKYGERAMVLTTDADDEPCHALATFNGGTLFLGYNAHRVEPVTHYQRLDAPPADWKLPLRKPKLRKPKRPAAPLHAEGGSEA